MTASQQPPRRVPRNRQRRPKVSYQDLGQVARHRHHRRRYAFWGAVAGLCLAILAVVFAAVKLRQGGTQTSTSSSKPVQNAVIIVISGVGADDLRVHAMPHVQALQRGGIRFANAWVGQGQPAAAASNATIATGVYPDTHGLIGAVWRDPGQSVPSTALHPYQVRRGSLDRILKTAAVSPLARVLRRRYPHASVLSVGGVGCVDAAAASAGAANYVLCAARYRHRWVAAAVAGHAPPPGFLHVRRWRVPVASGPGIGPAVEGWVLGHQDDWVTRVADWAIHKVRPRLTIITYPEVADVLRWTPAAQRSRVLGKLLTGIDRNIGQVLQTLRSLGMTRRTVVVVTSGGVLVPVHSRIRPAVVDEAIASVGAAKVYVSAGASVAIGLRAPQQAQPVAQALQAEDVTRVDAIYFKASRQHGWMYQAQYRKKSIRRGARAAFDHLVSTIASEKSPDVVEVLSPGTTADGARLGTHRISAADLGLQWPSQHIPFIISGDVGRAGATSSFPAQLTDIAPTIARLMNLTVGPWDGVVLTPAIAHPTALDAKRFTATGRTRETWVLGLQKRVSSFPP